MPLSYLHEDCHKQVVTHIRESRRFESMYTLQGKTRSTRHIRFPHQSMYARRMLSAGSPRTWQPFMSHQQSWTESLLPRKGLPTQSTAHWLTDPWVRTQFLSRANQWSSGESYTSINSRLLGLPGPYHRHAIGAFNTCSRGANRTVFNRHRRGLQHWKCRLSTYHSPTFPTNCLPFPLVAPPGLHFYQAPLIKPLCWVLKNLWPARALSTTQPSTRAYIYT
jgi:hypothetical protein